MRGGFWRQQMCKSLLRAMLMATIFVVFSTSLFSQQTGQIVGTIADPSGAVVPNAKVILTNTQTKDIRVTTSNAEGFFAFSSAQVGDFSVKVEASGFRSAELSGTHVSPGDRRDLSVALAVATESTSVTVEASAE